MSNSINNNSGNVGGNTAKKPTKNNIISTASPSRIKQQKFITNVAIAALQILHGTMNFNDSVKLFQLSSPIFCKII